MRKPATKITVGCVGRMAGLPGWRFVHWLRGRRHSALKCGRRPATCCHRGTGWSRKRVSASEIGRQAPHKPTSKNSVLQKPQTAKAALLVVADRLACAALSPLARDEWRSNLSHARDMLVSATEPELGTHRLPSRRRHLRGMGNYKGNACGVFSCMAYGVRRIPA